jgi:hypothetical protein
MSNVELDWKNIMNGKHMKLWMRVSSESGAEFQESIAQVSQKHGRGLKWLSYGFIY